MKFGSNLVLTVLPFFILAKKVLADVKRGSNVISISSEEQFYEIMNHMDNGDSNTRTTFNFVKYYTTWCSHCKKLNPVFQELSSKYGNNTHLHFCEVDCDIFGNNLCKKLPGYPMIEVITTTKDDLPSNDKQIEAVKDERYWWQKVWSPRKDPNWVIDEDRIIQYKGRRDFESLSNFIDRLIDMDNLQDKIYKIISGNDTHSELFQFYNSQLVQNIKYQDPSKQSFILDNDNIDKLRLQIEDMYSQGTETNQKLWTEQLWFINWLVDKQIPFQDNSHEEL